MVQGPNSPSLTALSGTRVSGTRVSENSLEPSPAGISDLRAEISRWIVTVRRSGKVSRRYHCQLIFFSPFQSFCLKHAMWKTHWLHFSNKMITWILRLASRKKTTTKFCHLTHMRRRRSPAPMQIYIPVNSSICIRTLPKVYSSCES